MKFSLLLFLFWFNSTLLAQNDTISIYFDIGQYEATELELNKIQVDKTSWEKVDIISFTDYLGSKGFNDRLSLKRSLEIRARLIQSGLSSEVLGNVEGRGITGKTLPTKKGIQKNRRTDIIIWKTDSSLVEKIKRKPVRLPKKENENEIKLSEKINKSVVGDQLIIKGLDFIPGQHFLTQKGDSAFVELLEILRKKESLVIHIEGHICCNLSGQDGLDLSTNKYNLSKARAEYIYNRLMEEGIDSKRLSYEGFARKRPIYPHELTPFEKQANRRVEIKIIKK